MFNSGFKESQLDGTEKIFDVPKNMGLPKQYSYMKYLPNPLNQGSDPICVPCSISAFLNWDINTEKGNKKDNKIDVYEIFNNRKSDSPDGMEFKEAFEYLMENGVKTKEGRVYIKGYAQIRNELALKFALITNGPCVAALPVYDSYQDEFWKKDYDIEGYHAIAIIGYIEEGFIIRISWGSSYGEDGCYLIKNEDINKFIEIWTLIR